MIYTIIWGIVIGILVSAPLGPIGVLVIQRTLNKGRHAGLMTGLGASVSDVLYALVSGLGLSFIVDFVNSNQSALQIVGSIVIFIFGFYLWKKNPLQDLNAAQVSNTSHATYFATGFVLTLSNPLIIFFYMALFARTNFLMDAHTPYHYLIGYMSVAIGALIWWFFITWVMNKARNHFKIRSLFLVNKVIAIVMVLISVAGFILGVIAEIDKLQKPKEANLMENIYEPEKKEFENSVYAGIRPCYT
ncbi:MAG: LysE family translocator [Bacteroidales bacterium]